MKKVLQEIIYQGKKFIPVPRKRRTAKNGRFIEISGATGNNLKKVTFKNSRWNFYLCYRCVW